jgi:hypothetical protein
VETAGLKYFEAGVFFGLLRAFLGGLERETFLAALVFRVFEAELFRGFGLFEVFSSDRRDRRSSV